MGAMVYFCLALVLMSMCYKSYDDDDDDGDGEPLGSVE